MKGANANSPHHMLQVLRLSAHAYSFRVFHTRAALCRCGQVDHKTEACNEQESCVPSRDRGAFGERFAHIVDAGLKRSRLP